MAVNQEDHFKPAPSLLPGSSQKPPEAFSSSSETRTSQKEKIRSIFNRQTRQEPAEIFQQLVLLENQPELASSSQKDDQSTPTLNPENKNYSLSSADQSEIDGLIKGIREAASKSLQTNEDPHDFLSQPLFQDRPTLYSQHHQEYLQELKTIKGKYTRLKDIALLRKNKVNRPSYTYDGLRSIGVSRHQIMENDTSQFPRISKTLYLAFYDSPKEYRQPFSSVDLPKNIERLYSLGQLNPNFLSSDQEFSDTYFQAYRVSAQTDQQFQQTRETLNRFPFLSGNNILGFFENEELSTDVIDALSFLKKEYFSDPQNYQKMESYLSKSGYSNRNLFSDLTPNSQRRSSDRYLSNLVSLLINSGINPGQKITIPQELIKLSSENEFNHLNCLANLETRDQQVFLAPNWNLDQNWGYFASHYFDSDGNPNLTFFQKLIDDPTLSNAAVVIPSQVLDSIQDPDQREFLTTVSSLPQRQFQKHLIYLRGQDYFHHNLHEGQLQFNFFKKILTDKNIDLKPIPPKDTPEAFGLDLREAIYQISQVSYPDLQDSAICRQFLLDNLDQRNSYFNENGQLTSAFYHKFLEKSNTFNSHYHILKSTLTKDLLTTYSPEDQKLWTAVLGLKDLNHSMIHLIINNPQKLDSFFNENGQPTSLFFETSLTNQDFSTILNSAYLKSLLTPDLLATYSKKDQQFWKNTLGLKHLDQFIFNSLIDKKNQDNLGLYFNDNHQPTAFLFKDLVAKNLQSQTGLNLNLLTFLEGNLTPETIATFQDEDQKLFNFIKSIKCQNKLGIVEFILPKSDSQKYFDNDSFTPLFYKDFSKEQPLSFINRFGKNEWSLAFGQKTISDLLDNLPTSTDEKRNAFTHNPYDRTTQFFQFLINNQESGFVLDSNHLNIASDYIKNYGLSRSLLFYSYFQQLSLYEQGTIKTLPWDVSENRISSKEDLKREIAEIQRKCFSSKPLDQVDTLSPFQTNLLSFVTGHSSNRFTRINLETIIQDFSRDFNSGKIAPLPQEFTPESITQSLVKVEANQDFSQIKSLVLLKEEILPAIEEKEDITYEKTTLLAIFNSKLADLENKLVTIPVDKQPFFQKQISAYQQQIDLLSTTDSVDSLLSQLVSFNINHGESQDKFNSLLRRLVFKKVFLKHQQSPLWEEGIRDSLQGDDPVTAVDNALNLLSNTIKDHVLNFETKNQDGYWDPKTFEIIKKFSSVFKKNLSFPAIISDLKSAQEHFITTKLNASQTISLVPDRGLIGELSGYLADVCYTKVYPLLKQYPDLIPYKFVSNPDSDNPELIGSTLVFQVKDSDDQPAFLIRAFNLPPKSQSINAPDFFETFVQHLSKIAKKMGVKKIITAGTSGTISNYPEVTGYVINKYVNGNDNVPLKDPFIFNGYNITNNCYLIKDLSQDQN